MDKISGIIPANQRITTVDVQRSAPVRRGVPSFGRDVVTPTNHRALAKTTLEEASRSYDQYSDSKQKMRIQSKMADNMAKDFFMEKRAQLSPVNTAPQDIGTTQVGTNLAVKA
tara:strand:+ start:2354 stop:2692 length:339 start_codon:yes stop_codon:yes gene_type:complete